MPDAVADLDDLAVNVAAFSERAVRHVAKGLAKPIRKQLKRDTGGDSRLSGIGNARLNVSTRVKVTGGRATGVVAGGPKKLRGPWSWLEAGTAPHSTRRGVKARDTRRAGVTGLDHPGTPAKRTWSRPVERVVVGLERDVAVMWEQTL